MFLMVMGNYLPEIQVCFFVQFERLIKLFFSARLASALKKNQLKIKFKDGVEFEPHPVQIRSMC